MRVRAARLALVLTVPAAFATSLVVTSSCAPVASSTAPAPLNSCPANPCAAYDAQATAPQCVSGACIVDSRSLPAEAGVSPTGDLILLVTTSQTGFFSPGLTFVLPWNALRDQAAAGDGGATATSGSATLPGTVTGTGLYVVSPQIANLVRWNLGSQIQNVSLPIVATFQLLSIPRSDGPDGSIIDLSPLPVPAVSVASAADGTFPGPNGTMGTAARVSLVPGTYQVTWTPVPPFNQAFGPVIRTVTPAPSDPLYQGAVESYDKTVAPGGNLELPTYNIVRDDRSFDGWTAYLRDIISRQPISNIVPLSGRETDGVQFAVRRVPADGGLVPTTPPQNDDTALLSAQLVLAPPAGSSEPAQIFTAADNSFDSVSGDGTTLRYLTLPPAVTVTGEVHALHGATGPVDLTFEALAVTRTGGLDPINFEFTAHVTASPDASGGSTFSVVLPPGEYRIDAYPRYGGSALALEDLLVPVQSGPLAAPPITLGDLQPTVGKVVLSDGRPLGGANVVGVPLGCAPVSATAKDAPSCLPRSMQTMSAADGSFVLGLDPGTYRIHVEPPQGSRLPWVDSKYTLAVQSSAAVGAPPAETLVVPAPLSLGLRLIYSSAPRSAIPNALVRAYRMFGSGPTATALELGEALTDNDGNFELYVAPPE